MKKYKKTILGIIIFVIISIILFFTIFFVQTRKVSNKSNLITFGVKPNNTYLSIGEKLKENKLIKSVLFYKLYVKINKPNNLTVGEYTLNQNMSVKEIINVLSKQVNSNSIRITFKEGKNIRDYAKIISENTNNTVDDFINTINDKQYLDELINKYWFLTNDIKNEKIYYALEGYLFPDTYEFISKDVNSKEIIEKLLNHTSEKLDKYKDVMLKSNYTFHQIITLASMVELEAQTDTSRKDVAQVFYNRLALKMSLGSDVTTYYAVKKDFTEELTRAEYNDYNDYNTRSVYMKTLPVSPICNPGLESIDAAINPNNHDYLFFVADKYKETYYSKTQKEHDKIINDLKVAGKWYEYNN